MKFASILSHRLLFLSRILWGLSQYKAISFGISSPEFAWLRQRPELEPKIRSTVIKRVGGKQRSSVHESSIHSEVNHGLSGKNMYFMLTIIDTHKKILMLLAGSAITTTEVGSSSHDLQGKFYIQLVVVALGFLNHGSPGIQVPGFHQCGFLRGAKCANHWEEVGISVAKLWYIKVCCCNLRENEETYRKFTWQLRRFFQKMKPIAVFQNGYLIFLSQNFDSVLHRVQELVFGPQLFIFMKQLSMVRFQVGTVVCLGDIWGKKCHDQATKIVSPEFNELLFDSSLSLLITPHGLDRTQG